MSDRSRQPRFQRGFIEKSADLDRLAGTSRATFCSQFDSLLLNHKTAITLQASTVSVDHRKLLAGLNSQRGCVGDDLMKIVLITKGFEIGIRLDSRRLVVANSHSLFEKTIAHRQSLCLIESPRPSSSTPVTARRWRIMTRRTRQICCPESARSLPTGPKYCLEGPSGLTLLRVKVRRLLTRVVCTEAPAAVGERRYRW